MKKNKISKNWLARQKRDIFFKRSKIEGFRSRSAFKLIEMNNKFNFLKKRSSILDLGSCPGGWSQVVIKEAPFSKILAVDLKEMQKIQNVDFIKGDFRDKKVGEKIQAYFNNKIDIVLSDMAANTTGNKALDTYQTGELCLSAMNLSLRILNKNGVFISKLFMGISYNEININAKKNFKKVAIFKPKSSRKESREVYIYCKDLKININNS